MELFASRMSCSLPKPQFPRFQRPHAPTSHRPLLLTGGATASFRARVATPGAEWTRSRLASSETHEQLCVREEVESTSYDSSDDESSYLSLSEKPDRNTALLDDYEMEELEFAPDTNHKSGYVAVLGKPNVGKSTLANQMIGQKLSIVTDKPQTTRHRILGICSGPDYQ
ncbi:hypothetical protein CRG98_008826, partial [Punica granatum]